MSVTRYWISSNGIACEDENGEFVKHEDYEALEQKLIESDRYGRQADITIENLEHKLAVSQREFRAADATIENLQMQVEKLAAENAGLKAVALDEIEVINRGGQAYCVKDGMSVNPIYARGWNDYRAKALSVETPATDYFLDEVRAQGVDVARNAMIDFVEGEVGPNENVPGLIRSAEICVSIAANLRKGVQS